MADISPLACEQILYCPGPLHGWLIECTFAWIFWGQMTEACHAKGHAMQAVGGKAKNKISGTGVHCRDCWNVCLQNACLFAVFVSKVTALGHHSELRHSPFSCTGDGTQRPATAPTEARIRYHGVNSANKDLFQYRHSGGICPKECKVRHSFPVNTVAALLLLALLVNVGGILFSLSYR